MTVDSNELNNIDGISIVNIKDVIAPVYSYFNLNIGDKQMIDKASEYVEELASLDDLEKMRSYLWMDAIFNIDTLNLAVSYGLRNSERFYLIETKSGEEIPILNGYWIAAQGGAYS